MGELCAYLEIDRTTIDRCRGKSLMIRVDCPVETAGEVSLHITMGSGFHAKRVAEEIRRQLVEMERSAR